MSYITMPQGLNQLKLDEDLHVAFPRYNGSTVQQSILDGITELAVELVFNGYTSSDEMLQAITICKNHNPALLSTEQMMSAATVEAKATLGGELDEIIAYLDLLAAGEPATNDGLKLLKPIIQAIKGLIV